MLATASVYLGLTLPLAARLLPGSRLAFVAVATPVALIYAGAFIAALFVRSRRNPSTERLSSRVNYFGSIAFVLVTWSCAMLALVCALCFRLYHWISAM